MGDIWAQVSACRMMADRLQGLLDAVNLDDLGAEVRLRSENAMRDAIRRIPDGVYTSVVQHDGFASPIYIHCKVTANDDRTDVDYPGKTGWETGRKRE